MCLAFEFLLIFLTGLVSSMLTRLVLCLVFMWIEKYNMSVLDVRFKFLAKFYLLKIVFPLKNGKHALNWRQLFLFALPRVCVTRVCNHWVWKDILTDANSSHDCDEAYPRKREFHHFMQIHSSCFHLCILSWASLYTFCGLEAKLPELLINSRNF